MAKHIFVTGGVVSSLGKGITAASLGHRWFVATQAHPEFKSRPGKPHPLFRDFVKAACDRQIP